MSDLGEYLTSSPVALPPLTVARQLRVLLRYKSFHETDILSYNEDVQQVTFPLQMTALISRPSVKPALCLRAMLDTAVLLVSYQFII